MDILEDTREFGLIIIQSLPADDKPTGQILHDEVIKYKIFEEPNLQSSFYSVFDKTELFKLLSDIIDKVRKENYFPLLHFEVHGFTDGIQLASNENVYWQELLPFFRTINILLKNYLVIMLAACEGGNIHVQMDPWDRAPFRAVVCSFKKISWDDILKGFEAFYTNYFFELDVYDAVVEMNKSISKKENSFVVMPSERFFDKVIDADRDPNYYKKMILQLAIEQKLFNPEFKDVPLYKAREYFDKKTRRDFDHLKARRPFFTMTDLRV